MHISINGDSEASDEMQLPHFKLPGHTPQPTPEKYFQPEGETKANTQPVVMCLLDPQNQMKIKLSLRCVIDILMVGTVGWLVTISMQLINAMRQLELLKKQNEEFRTLLADFGQIEMDGRACTDKDYLELRNKLEIANIMLNRTNDFRIEKNTEQLLDSTNIRSNESYKGVYEVERLYRRIYVGVKEMWYYTSSELKKLRSLSKDEVVQKRIDLILEEGVEHKRALFADMYNLSMANGRMEWVRKEIKDLEETVERRLTTLQNPSDCDTANKVVCNLTSNNCGYGCDVHHAVYCLIVAYGTQRTMILESKGWHYSRDGWESVFQPVSNTCVSDYGITNGLWPPKDDIQVITLPNANSIKHKPLYLPLAIPKDLSQRLMTVHGDPSVWWVAQFAKFLLRPQEPIAQYLRDLMSKMNFQKPIVGVHVRRTDKVGTEAAFHSIEEYMHHVKEYYDTLALRQEVPVRRVYLASDDPSVYEDAKHKFPDYLFLGDPQVAKSASTASRYSYESLKGVVGDVHLLAYTDYLVCTFSSNLCRLAYEIMQTLNPDPSANFQSLDDIYYFDGQLAHSQKVLYNHNPGADSGQLEMRVGDVMGIAGNHYDGYSKGVNLRTNQRGLYPSFKAEDIIPLFEQNDYTE